MPTSGENEGEVSTRGNGFKCLKRARNSEALLGAEIVCRNVSCWNLQEAIMRQSMRKLFLKQKRVFMPRIGLQSFPQAGQGRCLILAGCVDESQIVVYQGGIRALVQSRMKVQKRFGQAPASVVKNAAINQGGSRAWVKVNGTVIIGQGLIEATPLGLGLSAIVKESRGLWRERDARRERIYGVIKALDLESALSLIVISPMVLRLQVERPAECRRGLLDIARTQQRAAGSIILPGGARRLLGGPVCGSFSYLCQSQSFCIGLALTIQHRAPAEQSFYPHEHLQNVASPGISFFRCGQAHAQIGPDDREI